MCLVSFNPQRHFFVQRMFCKSVVNAHKCKCKRRVPCYPDPMFMSKAIRNRTNTPRPFHSFQKTYLIPTTQDNRIHHT